MQQVFNIEVPIPENMVIISKDDYLELISNDETGQWWDINDLKKLLGFSRTKVINDILLNPKIKKDIDISKNPDGFVVYPRGKGSPYKILATRARKYFENNFVSILLES